MGDEDLLFDCRESRFRRHDLGAGHGSDSGHGHGPSGAAVPGAEVKATQTDTSAVRTISTGADGVYTLPSLPVGPYKVEVSKTGFAAYSQTGIVLQVNTSPTVDVTLKIGAATESIQVEANAALVETERTSVGSVMENQRILELPLNGRNPVELIALAALVPAGGVGTASMPGGLNISVGGGLPSGVGYYLDGAIYNNPFDAVNLPFPFPDALQEFSIETSSVSASTGNHAAGAVSAVDRNPAPINFTVTFLSSCATATSTPGTRSPPIAIA